MSFYEYICNSSFRTHLLLSLAMRTILIIYSEYHDKISTVPYTDVDYKVFTDAASHVFDNASPYLRHTYRYTPLLAIILTPNIFLHQTFGKFLFALIDIFVGILIWKIIQLNNVGSKSNINENNGNKSSDVSIVGACLWLYNPLSIAISTRGNADSISVLFVLLTLYYMRRQSNGNILNCVLAGIFHGVAIHFRLYPIAFSLPLYLSLSRDFKQILPNSKQLSLVLGCVTTLLLFTFVFYKMYGYDFLYESYLYHLVRKDTRHNFSVYFYMLYLSAELETSLWQKILTFLPQFVLLVVLSYHYGRNVRTLNFCLFCQALVMVAYNPVVTSQYFVWYLSLLPLSVVDLNLKIKDYLTLGLVWGIAQGAWLFPAYLLEFQGRQVFFFVWLQGIAFFCANLYVLARFIKKYNVE